MLDTRAGANTGAIATRYFGTDEAGNVTDLAFSRPVEGDRGVSRQTEKCESGLASMHAEHRPTARRAISSSIKFLGSANVPIFENVAALDRLPAKGATIFALPMKIKGRQRRAAAYLRALALETSSPMRWPSAFWAAMRSHLSAVLLSVTKTNIFLPAQSGGTV